MKATIREIAERVGVSSASVSLVLNHRDCRISEETRQKIFDTAREIGYVRKKDRIKQRKKIKSLNLTDRADLSAPSE